MTANKIGILITNIGTPEKPTPWSVCRYLNKFLNDKRIVELPRWVWWPILYGIILPFRSFRSAKLYQSIWTKQGSPLFVYSNHLATKLQEKLKIPVALGMHYSHPFIEEALNVLKDQHVSHLLILPLYPQYSATTTAATYDAVMSTLKKWRLIPEIRTINNYATNPFYIKTISDAIQTRSNKKNHLLFSFHSIPKKFIHLGDPYQKFCELTTKLIVEELQLPHGSWTISYQSRLGKTPWISPYTMDVLTTLPSQGIVNLEVICPGFATDCLETLEEISLRGKNLFFSAGGKSFHYHPALNDSDAHVAMLEKIILSHLQGWI